jgi:hypothetical protein
MTSGVTSEIDLGGDNVASGDGILLDGRNLYDPVDVRARRDEARDLLRVRLGPFDHRSRERSSRPVQQRYLLGGGVKGSGHL